MRITVFGADGLTGRLLVGQALAAGHQVTAATRQPESFPLDHEQLEVVGSDVLDPVAVDAVVAQRDAVLSTLGARREETDQHLFARALWVSCRGGRRRGQGRRGQR
jgi:uncharacterized protein YbjT (DUF2867 family)